MPSIENRDESAVGAFLKRAGAAFSMSRLARPLFAFIRERQSVMTTRVEIRHAKLPPELEGLSIAHLSDIHYGFFFEAKHLEKLVNDVNELRPDVVALTGDLFDGEVLPHAETCEKLLARLTAPLGKFAVLGNHDYRSDPERVAELYSRCGFALLRNQSARLNVRGRTMQIAGVDDMLEGSPDLPTTFAGIDAALFTIFLAHEPEFADWTDGFPADLQLSGHSHGGQVRLPLIGDVYTPPGGKKYVQGLHRLSGGRERYVYTSRGIGTTHLPVRFLCAPELAVITLRADIQKGDTAPR